MPCNRTQRTHMTGLVVAAGKRTEFTEVTLIHNGSVAHHRLLTSPVENLRVK